MKPGQQITMFDYDLELDLIPDEPIEPPNWDEYKEMVRKCKGLDEVMHLLPKYLVTFKRPVWRLPYPIKREICVYVGLWHSLSGWSWSRPKELLNIESWEPIEYKKGDQYSFNDTGFPYRKECKTNCEYEYKSAECLARHDTRPRLCAHGIYEE